MTSPSNVPYYINSPPYNLNTPTPERDTTPTQSAITWPEQTVRAMIINKELDGFATSIERNPVLAFVWETYAQTIVENERMLKHIRDLVQAQEHLKKAAELLGVSLHYTDGIRHTLANASNQQARNFHFLKTNSLNAALTAFKAPPPPLSQETVPPPGFEIKTIQGGLRTLAPITIKKPKLPPPNPEAAQIVAGPLCPTPKTSEAVNRLHKIHRALDKLAPLPTAAMYTMAPSTPVPVPTQMPSTFVPPPQTILPVPPPTMNAAEFIDLVTRSITENATNILNVAALSPATFDSGFPIDMIEMQTLLTGPQRGGITRRRGGPG